MSLYYSQFEMNAKKDFENHTLINILRPPHRASASNVILKSHIIGFNKI